MRNILSLIVTILLFALVGVVIIGVVIAWALGLGWLLSLIVPFSWFEATLLSLIVSIVVGYIAMRVLLSTPPFPTANDYTPSSTFVVDETIPLERFAESEEGMSDEAWFRFEIANHIYEDLLDMDHDLPMGAAQQKELAIRLTDIAVAVLKGRKPSRRNRQVRITVAQMRKELEAIGQQPYDTDILETAVATVNTRLSYDEDMADVVLNNTWASLD
ncbi:MAG: hypothetical protein IPM39_01660 [Chloroflexi bacterium]|nr:hypothetical protein [Chloroflexota bacterium]